MLRRLVSSRLTAPQQFRCFTIADIKLASLLPTTSDEGKVKRSETPKEEIANRLIAFDFHSYRYEANRVAASNTPELLAINQRALNVLTPLGIENLEQFSRSTAAALRELDRDILSLLRNNVKRAKEREERLRRLWEWLDPHVKAFTERVDAINSTASEPKPYSAYMSWVQPVHSHGSGQRMLGRDRKKSLNAILDRAFAEDWPASEVNPINFVVGARWQGKSLMLTEVVAAANTARGDNFGGVGISFNDIPYLEIMTACDVSTQFWARVVYAMYCAILP
ncbi:Hypothetical protein, putative, partial [Bodo saltans]